MLENLDKAKGLIFSPRVMLKIIEAGMDKSEAYDLVQSLSMECLSSGTNLEDLCLQNNIIKSMMTNNEISEIFDYKFYLRFTKHQFNSLGWNLD